MDARPLVCALAVVLVPSPLPPLPAAEPPPPDVPAVRLDPVATPADAAFDRHVAPFMARWNLPGGVVAVARDRRLLLLRAYGWADVAARQPARPGDLYRLASLSTPLTALTLLRLVDQGRLALDSPFLNNLRDVTLPADADPRLPRITLRQLLQHTGGWDRDQSFDPMFRAVEAARDQGAPVPADTATLIRYMLARPLDFDPGTRYAYSNFGYCLLGRVIESVTGQPYHQAVESLLLRPAGAHGLRLGRSRFEHRAPGEVRYYAQPGEPLAPSVFPDHPQVPWPYGGFHLEAMDAHGGWIGSAADLLRVLAALEPSAQPPLLTDASRAALSARPAPPVSVDTDTYYALGFSVRPQPQGANLWHTGSLPGTSTILVRAASGLSWVALFNARPAAGPTPGFQRALDETLWNAVESVDQWPDHDLFAPPR
jgi:N-acyl-D-amino-acid deacylase